MYSDPNLELDTPPPRSQFRRPWSPEPFVPYHNHESGGDEGVDEHGYGYGFTKVDHDLYGMDSSHHHHSRQQPQQQQKDNQDYSRGTSPHRQQRLQQQRQRREASDVSVEALDLADYARTLRFRQPEDPYPPFPSQLRNGNGNGNENSGLGSSTPVIPGLPGTRLGRTSPTRIQLRPPPNSLVSGSRGTLSSNTHTHQTLSSAQSQSRGRRTSRRPFSMPVTPQASSSRGHLNSYIHDNAIADPYSHSYPHTHSNPNRGPYIIDPETDVRASSTQEIDISHFPKWSRGWYNTPNNHHPTGDDLYDPIPPSRLNFDSTGTRTGKSPFDPSYNINRNNNHNPYGTYDLPSSSPPPPPLSSVGHGSTRDLLPWSNDPPEYGPPLDPLQKEERMRMLEREFGAKGNAQGKGKGKGRDDGMLLVDEEGKPFIGTVDEKGRLVTVGPKRRVAFRTIQVLLAVGACVPVLYAAVAIKPLDPKKPPPPANKPPIFVLYVLSVLTLLLLLYMFVIRPCCIVRRKPRSSASANAMGMGLAGMGMMVLPVGHNAKGKGKKNKGGKGKKGKGMGMGEGGDVQVNLIVDPDAFRLPGEDEDDSEDSEDESDDDYMMTGPHMPGGLPTHPQQYQYHQHKQKQKQKRKTKNRRQRRRGIREGLMMEAEWKVARAWAKKLAMLDVAGVVLWGAAFVFIMLGKRCPSGEFGGWCNAYNVSTASGCLLCVAFGVSLFFDVQDLHASKQSPRTRTK